MGMAKLVLALAFALSTVSPAVDAPRAGTYRILSYGATNRPPLVLGSVVLGAGAYKAYLNGGKLEGEGRYSFDAAKQQVTWESGPYKGVWGGTFTVDNGGKTHKIRLRSTTIAVNTLN